MPLKNPAVGGDIVASYNIYTGNSTVVWQAANTAMYLKSLGTGVISKLGIHVITSSGNISLGVYRGVGDGRLRVPGARLATTGSVACPAANAYAEISLDVPVTITPNDFLAFSCDNITASFLGTSGNSSTNLALGISFIQATAYPLPSSAGSLTASIFRAPQIIGAV